MMSEVERLKVVYEYYSDNSAVQGRWSENNAGNRAIQHERQIAIKQALGRAGLVPLSGQTILEVGCGSGGVLAGLRALGATPGALFGVDLLSTELAKARRRFPTLSFLSSNGEMLPFPDAQFDLVLLFTVFSSILDRTMAANVATEIDRVLRRGGAVLWYDFRFNNPRNPHVRGLSRAAIAALFPAFTQQLQTVTLLPPLARRLGTSTPLLYPLLASVPLLRTHYLGVLMKPR